MHTKGLGITNRILAEYVEMIMQSIPTSASTGKFPMSRQVRNHLADSRTTFLTCKALRRCPSAILAELAQRSNFGSIEPRSPMVRKTPRGLAPARVEQPDVSMSSPAELTPSSRARGATGVSTILRWRANWTSGRI